MAWPSNSKIKSLCFCFNYKTVDLSKLLLLSSYYRFFKREWWERSLKNNEKNDPTIFSLTLTKESNSAILWGKTKSLKLRNNAFDTLKRIFIKSLKECNSFNVYSFFSFNRLYSIRVYTASNILTNIFVTTRNIWKIVK